MSYVWVYRISDPSARQNAQELIEQGNRLDVKVDNGTTVGTFKRKVADKLQPGGRYYGSLEWDYCYHHGRRFDTAEILRGNDDALLVDTLQNLKAAGSIKSARTIAVVIPPAEDVSPKDGDEAELATEADATTEGCTVADLSLPTTAANVSDDDSDSEDVHDEDENNTAQVSRSDVRAQAWSDYSYAEEEDDETNEDEGISDGDDEEEEDEVGASDDEGEEEDSGAGGGSGAAQNNSAAAVVAVAVLAPEETNGAAESQQTHTYPAAFHRAAPQIMRGMDKADRRAALKMLNAIEAEEWPNNMVRHMDPSTEPREAFLMVFQYWREHNEE